MSEGSDRTYQGDPLIGQQAGEYVLKERVGTGGTGIVYRAEHPAIGKSVAVKVLRPDLARDELHMKSLLEEAKLVTSIGDRGIVDIFGFGQLRDGRQYVVMEYLQGQRLDALTVDGPVRPRDALELVDQLLRALSAAHEKGVLHRDLKPRNIFVLTGADGARYIKIVDFGLAKQLSSEGSNTAGKGFAGTAQYAAPEQIRGEPLDARADLYAIGIITFELLTGRLPFEGKTLNEVLAGQLHVAPPPLGAFLKEVPEPLQRFVSGLLAKARADRTTSAETARTELTKVRRALAPPRTSGAKKALATARSRPAASSELDARLARSQTEPSFPEVAVAKPGDRGTAREPGEAGVRAVAADEPAGLSAAPESLPGAHGGGSGLRLWFYAGLVLLVCGGLALLALPSGDGASEAGGGESAQGRLLSRIDLLVQVVERDAAFMQQRPDEAALGELRRLRLAAAQAQAPTEVAEVERAVMEWKRRYDRTAPRF